MRMLFSNHCRTNAAHVFVLFLSAVDAADFVKLAAFEERLAVLTAACVSLGTWPLIEISRRTQWQRMKDDRWVWVEGRHSEALSQALLLAAFPSDTEVAETVAASKAHQATRRVVIGLTVERHLVRRRLQQHREALCSFHQLSFERADALPACLTGWRDC